MKYWKQMTALLLSMLLLAGCSSPNWVIRERERYSSGSVQKAMAVVEKYFNRHFEGCTLLTIVYDESITGEKADRESEKYETDVIILLTDFTVDDSGGAPGLTPGMTYRNYEWTLVKTLFGWKLKDWGYA